MNSRSVAPENGAEEHSEVGPSSIASIILCPGKVRMCRGLEDVTSYAAAEGTVAHKLGENKLNGKKYPKIGTVIEQDGHSITVDKEMLEAVEDYIEHTIAIKGSIEPGLSYEELVEVTGSLEYMGLPELFGTADYVLSVMFDTLYIRDYKHGKGIMVEAENNAQLMCYALIAGQESIGSYERINFGIVQPRTREGAPIKTWEITPDELMDWAEDVLKPAVKLALSDDAPLVPGEKQCMWCRAAQQGICPAFSTRALQVAQEDFKDFADIRPSQLVESVSIEQVTRAYEQLPLLKQFIKSIELRVFNELSIGNKVEGFKLVKGRKSRDWADEGIVMDHLKTLGVDPYIQKVVSPAQAEKLLNKEQKKEVQRFIVTSDGTPVIVRDDDKREAITTAADDFAAFKN